MGERAHPFPTCGRLPVAPRRTFDGKCYEIIWILSLF